MALTTIRANLRQTSDVHRHFASKIALNFESSVNELTDADNLALCQVLDPGIGIHTGPSHNLLAPAAPDAIDIGQPNLYSFVSGKIYSRNSGHCRPPLTDTPAAAGSTTITPLALTLFMSWILTNHSHHTTSPDNLALGATSLD
jgi:hypothetical protein